MVIKGSARGGAGELATHLLRADTNEKVTVLELSGVAADNLRDALLEMDGMGAGSRSKRTLYHASINTPYFEQMTIAQQHHARERLAEELGLAGKPYAMVEHVKHGRQHTHIVWLRIDPETGKAVPDSHNYRRHELVSRDLERDFRHELVKGVHTRDKANDERPQRGPTWGEQRQAERSGMSPKEAKRIVTDCWKRSATGAAFRDQVEDKGFILANGDRKDFVLVDRAGEIHGITRRIEGAKAADIAIRFADLSPSDLPSIEEARIRQAKKAQVEMEAEKAKEAEAKRLRDKKRNEEPKGSPLSGTHKEIADAIRGLNATMRAQMEQTIVSKPVRPPRPPVKPRKATPTPSAAERHQPAPSAEPRRTVEDDLRDVLKNRSMEADRKKSPSL